MKVRPAADRDLDAYIRIQEEEWGESMAASRLQLESRLNAFPDGVLVAEHDGEVIAGATFMKLPDYNLADARSWSDLTEDGWCNNHDPEGSALFGVDLSVSRRAPRSASARIFAAGLALTVSEGTEGVYWGSRLPRYHKYADKMTPDEYLHTKNRRGRYLDPEIQLYSRIPGVQVLGVVPDYFKDWESENWGAILSWPNPVRRLPFLRPFSDQIISMVYTLERWRNKRT
ncbi:MAG: hypothetical protein ACRBK7_27670 [Acidimicrobiales bacterium]